MKQLYRLIASISVITLLLCMLSISAFAEQQNEHGLFPANVTVVPQGTSIAIDEDNGTVTISDNPVDIAVGDIFIVYLQDLPIGYVANSIKYEDNKSIILVEKADKSIYAQLEEEGVVELTSDMYDFIPASNDESLMDKNASPNYSITDYLKYQDGKLTVTVKPVSGTKIAVEFSNMSLSHSFSGGQISVVLNGDWKVSSEMSTTEDSLGEVKLGELRIYGVGKIALYIDVTHELSIKYTFSGGFSAGFKTTDDSNGHIIKSFSVSQKSVEGKGSIAVSLKITAGIDILVAEADIYASIGVKTQFKSKYTYHYDWDPPQSIHCDDFKIYIFSNVGAEAKYISSTGKKKKIASTEFKLLGEKDNPYLLDVHFENGILVNGCSEGMDTASIEMDLGGIVSGFGSTLSTDGRDRVLETSVNMPWDIETDGDYYISNGNLNLNGHTLTVNGDLIQSGGTLTIDGGTLIVHGNYRIQSLTDGTYGDSSGTLNMNSSTGRIIIDGDLIIQTTSVSHSLNAGTINVKGNINQLTPTAGSSHFNTGTGLNIVLTADNSHTLSFEDASNNSIGWLTFENDVTAMSSITIGKVDLNGHKFVINGTFNSRNSIDLQDMAPENITDFGSLNLQQAMVLQSAIRFEDMKLNGYELTVNGDMISNGNVDLDGGVLTITGTLYHQSGQMNINGGKLNIGGNYYIVGSDSRFGQGIENYTSSEGYLRMVNANDEVRVGGDFITKSYYSTNYYGSDRNVFTAGVLYVGGNFRQLGSDSSSSDASFSAQSGHKTVLTNTESVEIEFRGSESGFGKLEIAAKQIMYKGYANWCGLLSDLNNVISDGMQLSSKNTTSLSGHNVSIMGNIGIGGGGLNINTGSLSVDGNVTMTGGVNIDAGDLNITGTLYHQSGQMNINGGKLNIGGNYYIVGSDSRFGQGIENYTSSEGYLRMVNANDEVRVGGDFITKSNYSTNYYGSDRNVFTAGVLYVGGNFRQLGTKGSDSSDSYASFSAQSGHKTVLTNTESVEIEFRGSQSGFGKLEVESNQVTLTYKGYANWCSLVSDLDNVISDGMQLSSKNATRLSGHSVSITGNVTMIGTVNIDEGNLNIIGTLYHQNGLMNINNGKLNIGGNYYILGSGSRLDAGVEIYNASEGYLRMVNANDEVWVGGDFITKSNYSTNYYGSDRNVFTAGVLYVGGNFRQLGSKGSDYSDSYASFSAQSGHKTVLNGNGKIEVEFLGSSSHFGTLEITQPIGMYEFNPNPCWITLIISETPAFGQPEFTLPAALMEIDESAFEGISATIVYIPDTCISIGAYAFRDAAVIQIRIPAGCSIDDTAFDGCGKVQVFGTIGSEAETFCDAHDNCTFIAEY